MVHQLHLLTMCCCLSSRSSSNMAADDKSSSSSSTDWSVEPPVISPTSPSHLTHFKPLTPEQDEPPLRSAYSSFVSLFRFNNKGLGCSSNTSIQVQVYLFVISTISIECIQWNEIEKKTIQKSSSQKNIY